MSVSDFKVDLYPLLQYVFTAIVIAIGFLHLVKNTASNYFVVDANFEEGGGGGDEVAVDSRFRNKNQMIAAVADCGDGCAVCGEKGIKKCSECKSVRYCSTPCQSKHWRDGHRKKCQELKLSRCLLRREKNASLCDSESKNNLPKLKKVLFPYEDFVKLFSWEEKGSPPCGLLNCGNSCYANVVLQCLSCTRPLIAYLLEIGHARKCKRNEWCFLCELESHLKRTRRSWGPFSPINILSRLPHIGGNLGYGKQEDAHEFMRFAIDTMQSVCLDEFGGEKALHPISQETTLIQYIFGGHLKSQVKCLKCNKISYRHENMMDLTVEIQGDAESVEECLEQFTAEESLDGENMYKCDGCNDYVRACKRLAIHHAPNILTITLKRFQSGRFGKLNKRVSFPETLDLGPYMSEPGYGSDMYQLYAVVVHIDMLNASYFGHYICYTKDFHGNWFRIDDCKVTPVELEEVLAQGAYMLLYSRRFVGPPFVEPEDLCKEEQVVEEAQPCLHSIVEAEGTIGSEITIVTIPTSASSSTENQQEVELAGSSLSPKPETLVAETEHVVEEAQPCSQECVVDSTTVENPVEESEGPQPCLQLPIEGCTVEPSINGDEEDSSVCRSLDESAAANTTVSPPSSLDMDIDGLPSRVGDELSSSSSMEVDVCESKYSDDEVPTCSGSNDRLQCERSDIHSQLAEASTSQAANTCRSDTTGKQKPIFSRGFLDKRARHEYPNGNGNCNGFSSDVEVICDPNPSNGEYTPIIESDRDETDVMVSSSVPEVAISGETEMVDSESSDTNGSGDNLELPHKVKRCNGGSVTENGRRNKSFDYGKLFSPVKNVDDDENNGDPRSQCNGTTSYKEDGTQGHKKLRANGLDAALSPGFLNKPLSRKKSEQNKLQKVG